MFLLLFVILLFSLCFLTVIVLKCEIMMCTGTCSASMSMLPAIVGLKVKMKSLSKTNLSSAFVEVGSMRYTNFVCFARKNRSPVDFNTSAGSSENGTNGAS